MDTIRWEKMVISQLKHMVVLFKEKNDIPFRSKKLEASGWNSSETDHEYNHSFN